MTQLLKCPECGKESTGNELNRYAEKTGLNVEKDNGFTDPSYIECPYCQFGHFKEEWESVI
jgi:RNA polymerase subunit RPABC4/transcription elongation factor Spt4